MAPFSRCIEVECLAWTFVAPSGNGVEPGLRAGREIGSFREGLSRQPVRVFVRAACPDAGVDVKQKFRFDVVPVRLGENGIAKHIFQGAREADGGIDYLRAFIEQAKRPGGIHERRSWEHEISPFLFPLAGDHNSRFRSPANAGVFHRDFSWHPQSNARHWRYQAGTRKCCFIPAARLARAKSWKPCRRPASTSRSSSTTRISIR